MSSHFTEPARELVIQDQCDVIVCGGGPAGVAAAIAAARTGAKTRLFELHGCLGGIWTAGLLSWVLDCSNKSGIFSEIRDRLTQQKAGYSARGGNFISEIEPMKCLLETMCVEAGVKIQLHTRVAGAFCNPQKKLDVIVTESKSGRQAWRAKYFVDATGDGDLGALAGCQFDYGRETDGITQPMSMIGLITGLDAEAIRPFNNTADRIEGKSAKKELLGEFHRAGVEPTYSDPALFHIQDGLCMLMANHEYGISAVDAAQITEATIRSRAENLKLVSALKSLGGVWKNIKLVATAEQIGVREGRRLHGLYDLTKEDLFAGNKQTDAICRVTFGIDVHSPDPKKSKNYDSGNVKAQPYDVPLRSLISRDVKGLLMAGRCISGDFMAHASYRVTGNSVVMGQAAGTAAALSALGSDEPQNIEWETMKWAIEKAGNGK